MRGQRAKTLYFIAIFETFAMSYVFWPTRLQQEQAKYTTFCSAAYSVLIFLTRCVHTGRGAVRRRQMITHLFR